MVSTRSDISNKKEEKGSLQSHRACLAEKEGRGELRCLNFMLGSRRLCWGRGWLEYLTIV